MESKIRRYMCDRILYRDGFTMEKLNLTSEEE